jgi:hypothetical protein
MLGATPLGSWSADEVSLAAGRSSSQQVKVGNQPLQTSQIKGREESVRFRLCMSMEWMNECVDMLFITQLLKACLSTVCMS